MSGPAVETRHVVRRAVRADIPALASALTDGFWEDPFLGFIVGDGPRRRERLERLFVVTLESLSNGLGDTHTIEGGAGCVVWRRSEECKLSWWRELALIPAFCRVSGVGRIGELLRVFGHLEALHAQHAPDSHHYLHVIGVARGEQGRGIGRSLLEPSLRRFDREGKAAYLETFNRSNLSFYERLGFRVAAPIEFAPAPRGWAMRREPNAG